MTGLTNKNKENNNLIYIFLSYFLYLFLYILITKQFKGLYNPILGGFILIGALSLDFLLYRANIRILIRLVLIILFYLALKYLIGLFSFLTSPPDGYNILSDKLPYVFKRDTLIALFFIIIYFAFDSIRNKNKNTVGFIISSIVLVGLFFMCLNFNVPIQKTVFNNYFNLAMFSLFITVMLLLRFVIFYQNNINRNLDKKDMLLFLVLIIVLAFSLFNFILPEHIKDKNKGSSSLFQQNLFQFDFSNYLELRDEIKQSDDRVLILELEGVKDDIQKRINEGWNRQIYLKRFALEEYNGEGRFKVSDNYVDPMSPPTYLSGYMWQLKNKPQYKGRVNVIETLYLINIDPTSLMGSDLLTKVTPVTNWQSSSYKQIYRSYCNILDLNYEELYYLNPAQNNFLNTLNPDRKKLLLNWGGTKEEFFIKNISDEVTKGLDGPYDKTIAIMQYLRNNYYYSLKPGLAKKGNQLEYFLLESKKGYCSYFAFAMTLMLRSQGIASRVVVGFAPDMKNKTLNFYDVRSLHGHAWVEVYFDDYGWVTFDPTSSNFAPGEKYDLFMGSKEERDGLIEEILKNKDKMKEITKEKDVFSLLEDIKSKFVHSLRIIGLISFILIILSFIGLIYIKKNINLFLYYMAKDIRKKIVYIYKYIMGMLMDAGYSLNPKESIVEYSKRMAEKGIINLDEITELYQKALFRETKNFEISAEKVDELKKILIATINARFTFKKRLFSFFNITRLWKKIFSILLIFLFLNSNNMMADDYTNVDDYILNSRDAVSNGYYDQALDLLNRAEKKFPSNYKPNLEKGKLYYHYELYENALIEFKKAKNKGCRTEENYQYLASSYGKIGEYNEAVKVYEEAFDNLYYSIDLYDKLGWMYFKINKVDEGIKRVKDGLKLYPNSSDLLMTLGTLYSTKYDYKRSKYYYLEAIKNSYEDYNTNYFRSIVYYNLSLLEKNFLFYDDAYNSAKASISLDNRSSPHLQLNYLYIGALDLRNAYNEILISSSLTPKTFFPEMSLVYVYIYSGRVDEAIALTKDLLNRKDFSWMLYFGTNKDEYYAELYMNLSLAYEYKSKLLKFNDKQDFISVVARSFKRIYYNILNLFYNYKYTNIYLKIAEQKIKGGAELDGLNFLIYAYDRIWPGKALKILRLAHNIERTTNPQKDRIYNIKEAVLNKKSSLFYSKELKKKIIKQNIILLDTKWEKDMLSWSLLEMIKDAGRKEKNIYIEELYNVHPAMLVLNGIKTGFKIEFIDKDINRNVIAKLLKYLKKRGIINSSESSLILEIGKIGDNDYIFNVNYKNKMIKTFTVNTGEYNIKNFYDNFSLDIFNRLFLSEIY
jgi:tetratricopeptide (TPR) repeat protein